jgi:aspartyl-tRNA(Asn)/glutamyl-tRNA(Gln) amidotransferase subunit C
MAHITEKELASLARLSRIHLASEELAPLAKDIEGVLGYASSLAEIAKKADPAVLANVQFGPQQNVMREDVVVASDPEPILAQAPEREGDFFIVPRILQRN